MTTPTPAPAILTPRTLQIVGGVLVLIGFIVGVIPHSDSDRQTCGTPLLPSSLSESHVQLCDWALRGGTTWMWLLLFLGAVIGAAGLVTAIRPGAR